MLVLTIAAGRSHARGSSPGGSLHDLRARASSGISLAPPEQSFLLFLPRSTWRVGVLLNVPVDEPVYNVFRGIMFRGNYPMPTFNMTKRERGVAGGSARGGSRWSLYSLVEEALDRAGLESSCLLRGVCEAAAAPFLNDGLLGELLHVLLTPSSSGERSRTAREREFERAERWGAAGRDCGQRYTCHGGALEHFTTLV